MIQRLIDTNPVRLYAVVVAAIAIGAYFIPSGAWPLVAGLAAAVLGIGEGVRSQVWSKESHESQMNTARRLGEVRIPTLGDKGQSQMGLLIIVILVIVIILLATGRL